MNLKLRASVTIAAVFALAACSPKFDPASKVEGLRVLAIKAEPPEIEPVWALTVSVAPDRATLSSLVLRPDFVEDPSRKTTILHLACIPTPGDLTPSLCLALASLSDPTILLAQDAQMVCAVGGSAPGSGSGGPPVTIAGVEQCDASGCVPAVIGGMTLPAPEVVLPTGFGDTWPEGPEEILGTEAVVLAFAIDATPDELVEGAGTTCPIADVATRISDLWPSREHVLSTKQIQIRGPDAGRYNPEPNLNPEIDGIVAGVTTLDPSSVTTVSAGTISLKQAAPPPIPLKPVLLAPDYQAYTKLDAAANPMETTTEEWVYSWFATAGDLAELHTHDDATPDEWSVSPPPEGTRAFVAVVVRDLRGGIAWAVREVVVVP